MFSAFAIMAFSVGSMANDVEVKELTTPNCEAEAQAVYNLEIENGASHYQAYFRSRMQWIECVDAVGINTSID